MRALEASGLRFHEIDCAAAALGSEVSESDPDGSALRYDRVHLPPLFDRR